MPEIRDLVTKFEEAAARGDLERATRLYLQLQQAMRTVPPEVDSIFATLVRRAREAH